MAIELTNTTCDIYRNAHSPPAAPDVAAVPILLEPDFRSSHEAATISSSTSSRWTHQALCDVSTDIRDGYQGPGGGSQAGQEVVPSGQDHVWVPDKNGTPFEVIFVERVGQGTDGDCLRVFLQRKAPTWPTSNL
jgi:hypothetical protein